jgi:uncharacterized protein with HEPN domain
MFRSPSDLLRHMLVEIDFLHEVRGRATRESLNQDGTLQRAVSRSIEIIGEASKQMPASFRDDHPEVPWKMIAGMRDRLIHGYFAGDYDIVWDVIETKLPELRPVILSLIDAIDD